MTEARKCPPLGAGSIDFDALHAADAKGKQPLADAITEAVVAPPAPVPASSADASDAGAAKPDPKFSPAAKA